MQKLLLTKKPVQGGPWNQRLPWVPNFTASGKDRWANIFYLQFFHIPIIEWVPGHRWDIVSMRSSIWSFFSLIEVLRENFFLLFLQKPELQDFKLSGKNTATYYHPWHFQTEKNSFSHLVSGFTHWLSKQHSFIVGRFRDQTQHGKRQEDQLRSDTAPVANPDCSS